MTEDLLGLWHTVDRPGMNLTVPFSYIDMILLEPMLPSVHLLYNLNFVTIPAQASQLLHLSDLIFL